MAVLTSFLPYKSTYQPSAMHLCGQYIVADRFLRNSGYLVEFEVLSTLGVSFHPKEVLRNLKIPKFAKI